MSGRHGRFRNNFVKNLQVNFSIQTGFKRDMVHKSVSFLKKELNFQLNALVINFVSSEEIIKINSEYLGHHFATDIITFNYSETNSDIDGEIYISLEDALKNAVFYDVLQREEITRLVTHGILHLLGYNDQEKGEKRKMKKIENDLVKKQSLIWNK
jgi:probable rRNA maturation factor